MKNTTMITMTMLVVAILFSGCAGVMSPATGILYSSTEAPIAATMADGYTKSGSASCTSILGIVASGNASITAAMKNGGITKIHHVDYHSMQVLGLYAEMTTTVYGE